MKLILTESQIKFIKEAINTDYMDHILDKISAHGYEMLSDREKSDLHKMSNGEEVEPEGTEQPEIMNTIDSTSGIEDIGCSGDECMGDSFRMFMNNMPERMSTTIDGKNWVMFVDEDNGPEHIVVTDGDVEFYVVPFWNGEGMKFEMLDGRSFIHHIDSIPENPDDMYKFMSHFFKYVMPIMIKKIKKEAK